MSPPPCGGGGGGGGDIVFSKDPVGGGVASEFYLLIEWTDFGQTYTNISLGGEKC